MKKLILAAALSVAATGASASDVEWSFGFGDSNVPIQEFVFAYNSQSVVVDSDGDGVISVGDAIQSFGGYGPMGFDALGAASPLTALDYETVDKNLVSGFIPGFPLPADYGQDYIFSFYFNDLMGYWDGEGFRYTSGTIQFGWYDTGFNNLFSIDLASGGNDPVLGQAKQVFLGEIDETSLENGAGAGFTLTQNGTTMSLSDWLAGDKRVLFDSNQTVTAGLNGLPTSGSDIVFAAPGDTALLAANHTGRFSLNVPEPSTIAVLGLSLIGFGAAARKRKA
ncbi:PEP-CTERM sorting domain-containing protein [Alteromonas sp. CYL-A6]|uniref:PEP-CTERM sorting domain-containing protein n=1 Tax=Alteromonas nitratireducens TaxID=3390813 RepID=UPI0034B4F898